MKKILILITALLITFSLSGCEEAFPQDKFYTQEEVDEIIEDEFRKFENLLEEYMVWYEEENGNLYTQCQEASGWEECFVELDYVTQIELNNELMYYQLKIEELENRIEELEETE
jgi:hypothetical protein